MTRRRRAASLLLVLAVAGGSAVACSDSGGSDEELCALLGDGTDYADLFDQGLDPTDTERALAQLRAARLDLGRLRAAAPSEVDDDLDDEIAYVDAVIEVIEEEDPDDPAAVVRAVNALEEQRAAADVAGLELQAFANQACY